MCVDKRYNLHYVLMCVHKPGHACVQKENIWCGSGAVEILDTNKVKSTLPW